jgi:hypothetical protein
MGTATGEHCIAIEIAARALGSKGQLGAANGIKGEFPTGKVSR